jgi:hypothetical protein
LTIALAPADLSQSESRADRFASTPLSLLSIAPRVG